MATRNDETRRVGRPLLAAERMRTTTMSVRMTQAEAAAFQRLAYIRCLTPSEVLRRYVRRFLADPNSCPDR